MRTDVLGVSPAVRFARWVGVLYASAGIVGFALTGLHDFTRRSGEVLLGFEVNPLLNTIHLLVGTVLVLASAAPPEVPRTVTQLSAAAFGVTGLLGLAIAGTPANVLAVNTPDNLLHLATALAASACALATPRSPASDRSGHHDPRTL